MTWYHLSAIYEPTNYLREIIGFDTFEGFPEISVEDPAMALLLTCHCGGLHSLDVSKVS